MIRSSVLITISVAFLSCKYQASETTNKTEDIKIDTLSVDTVLKTEPQPAAFIADTIKRLVVDDYPVTDEMLADKTSGQSSYHMKRSGQIYTAGKAWFTNDTLNQILVFELYTDYHRMITYHFYNKDVPVGLIDRMELYVERGELATMKQKVKWFNGFFNQTTKIASSYFATEKGFRLGDGKRKAIEVYGNPHKQSINNGVEELEWNFIGDIFYDRKSDLQGKKLAKDSFGHHIVMYFKAHRLIGLILYNDIP